MRTEMRYPESGWSRLTTGGRPVWDADADWARDTMVPAIDGALHDLAASKGASFLSLRDAFQGREICSTASRLVLHDGDTPDATVHEWMRFLVSGAQSGGSWSCTNAAGQGTGSMTIGPA